MELASSIADKILTEHGKLVSLKFIEEKEFESGKSPFINEIKGNSNILRVFPRSQSNA